MYILMSFYLGLSRLQIILKIHFNLIRNIGSPLNIHFHLWLTLRYIWPTSTTSLSLPPLYRMIAYELCIYVGLLLGSFASGYVYEASNAYVIFVISAASILFALFLMAALLPESLPQRQLSEGFVVRELWQSCARGRLFQDRSILVLLMCVLLLTAFVSGEWVDYYKLVSLTIYCLSLSLPYFKMAATLSSICSCAPSSIGAYVTSPAMSRWAFWCPLWPARVAFCFYGCCARWDSPLSSNCALVNHLLWLAVQRISRFVAGTHLAPESRGEQSDESFCLCWLANLSSDWLGPLQIPGESHVPHDDNESLASRWARFVRAVFVSLS